MNSKPRQSNSPKISSTITALVFFVLATLALGEGTKITAPKNNYKLADDVKAGQEAAVQVRKEMPTLPENGDIDSYVERVGDRLVAVIPPEFNHPEFRYEFSVVNAGDINAFALPGGPMFVNRGMIEAALTEGEMAGVMAHELSHVALRHSTAQATKSQSAGIQLGALGGAIAGAIIGGNVGEVVAQGTQIGLGTYMLKFSREYETQADVLGAQIMARAGYNPQDLGNMFRTIEKQGGSSGPQWLSDHPNPGNRYERISQEAAQLSISPDKRHGEQEFAAAQTSLKRMAPAPTMAEIAKSTRPANPNGPVPADAPVSGSVARPSDQYRTFDGGACRVSIPSNWKEYAGAESVTFAPNGAYGTYDGESVFTHGAIVGFASVSTNDLAKVSDQYVASVLHGNAYLQASGKAQRTVLGGKEALKRSLTGTSPVTRQQETVDIYTSLSGDRQLFYMVHVSPEKERSAYKNAFAQMVKTVRFLK